MATHWTRLHIGADSSLVTTGDGGTTLASLSIKLGARKTAADFFRHDPPTPLEWESAIQAIEDELERARTLQTGGELVAEGDALQELLATADGAISIEIIERRFQAQVLARHATPLGLPGAATLLILREFMHHLEFASVTLREGR